MSSSSSKDDSSGEDNASIINLQSDNHVTGFHLMPICQNKSDTDAEPPHKLAKDSVDIRVDLQSPSFIDQFTTSWNSNSVLNKEDVELIIDPFHVCVVQNLLQNSTILNKVLDEFNELDWNKRSLDLYEFFQSLDLKNTSSKYIRFIYDFLKNDVKAWVENLTGLELTSISATCSLYSDTDYLLVHDDQQGDRVVAFVLYLMGPGEWSHSNGGALQLFSKDEDGHPLKVIRDILPCNNQFVFFKVTNDSYHQVSEVMNKDNCRMSINGWYHNKAPVFKLPIYTPPTRGLFGTTRNEPLDIDLYLKSWINPTYFKRGAAKDIQDHLEEHSEIALHNYFQKAAIEGVLEQLQSSDIVWKQVGPPNRYSYEVAKEETTPELVQRFLKLFSSPKMFRLLHRYSDLDLVSVRYELQRWKPGCYSLLTDYDWANTHELDLVMFIGCEDSKSIIGGRIMYIETEEEIQDALITIEPVENCLNIVFRDAARIIKYVSKYTTCPMYYLLICSYAELN